MVAAIATALLPALIVRDSIGMPPDMVREDALIAASIMVAAVAGMSRVGGNYSSKPTTLRGSVDLISSVRNGW